MACKKADTAFASNLFNIPMNRSYKTLAKLKSIRQTINEDKSLNKDLLCRGGGGGGGSSG